MIPINYSNFILAMTVHWWVRPSHYLRARFTVLVECTVQ